MAIRLARAVVLKEVAGEEEALEILSSTGQQFARVGSLYVTVRLMSDGTTWLVV
ncbi:MULTISPECIES: hypothetical protein [Sorangium]|uniref:hypothetical protein n=1 Tax=Sorangium TaxID=39643 RepID=UPI003D9C1975